MRRSILLAICDFLILSALSLSSGIGTGSSQVSQAIVQQPFSDASLDKITEAWLDDYKVTDEHIKLVQAQRELESLMNQRETLESQLSDIKVTAAEQEKQLTQVDKSQQQLKSALDEKSRALKTIDSVVKDLSVKNLKLEDNLAQRDEELSILSEQTAEFKTKVSTLEESVEEKESHISSLKQQTGTLKNTFEKVIADKDKSLKEEKKRSKEELKKAEDLLEEKHKLEVEKSAKDVELAMLKKELKTLKGEGKEYVWERYHNTATQLDFSITDISGLKPQKKEKSLFFPEITVEGNTYLVGESSVLSLGWDRIQRKKISDLSISIKVDAKKTEKAATMLYYKDLPRLILIPKQAGETEGALKVLGWENLLRRGLEGLYLFKIDGSSSPLNCYYSARSPGYLFTKNASSSSTTLSASPGDFLMTKKGELIGIFTNYSRCYVIPSPLELSNFKRIPLGRSPKEVYYDRFATAVLELQKKLKE